MLQAAPKITVGLAGNAIRHDWNLSKGANGYIIYRAQYNNKTKMVGWSKLYTSNNAKVEDLLTQPQKRHTVQIHYPCSK